ncbi:MAG: hypothetical protein WCP63_05145 [Cyanobium sp. ELA712]
MGENTWFAMAARCPLQLRLPRLSDWWPCNPLSGPRHAGTTDATHPGVLNVYWKHYFNWGPDLQAKIRALINARKLAGVNAGSPVYPQNNANTSGVYAARIDGSRGRLYVLIGGSDASWQPGASGYGPFRAVARARAGRCGWPCPATHPCGRRPATAPSQCRRCWVWSGFRCPPSRCAEPVEAPIAPCRHTGPMRRAPRHVRRSRQL